MAVILIGYYDRENLNTIQGIIYRWAPPADNNNTTAYVTAVCDDCQKTPNTTLNLHEYADLCPLVKAIIKHENGEQPYDDATINAGLARAGIEIPKKPLRATLVIKGAAVAVVGQAADTGNTLLTNVPSLAQYASGTGWLHHICGALTGLGLMLCIVGKYNDHGKSITGGGT